MPIENLAKIFGPTVLGYSCADPDHHAILSETMVQKDVNTNKQSLKKKFESFAIKIQHCLFQVMENLLKTPADYWKPFIDNSSSKSTSSRENLFGKKIISFGLSLSLKVYQQMVKVFLSFLPHFIYRFTKAWPYNTWQRKKIL